MPVMPRLATISAAMGGLLTAGAAAAQEALNTLPILGRPTDGAMGFQAPATDHMADVIWLDNFLLVIITAISLFVMALLLIVIVRYNRRANPTPATFTHNSPLEVAWTFIPIVILVVIGAFSLPVLFQDQEIPEGDIHIKATGYQWYWSYDYVDEGVSFDSFMIGQGENVPSPDTLDELAAQGYGPDEFRLATDTAMVVPVGATVVLTVTAADVIHSWTVPAFGVKQDGVPGRLAQLWFKAETEGVFFGQCSELCGKDHAYMPITVKVVSEEVYQEWLVANGATPDEPAT